MKDKVYKVPVKRGSKLEKEIARLQMEYKISTGNHISIPNCLIKMCNEYIKIYESTC